MNGVVQTMWEEEGPLSLRGVAAFVDLARAYNVPDGATVRIVDRPRGQILEVDAVLR